MKNRTVNNSNGHILRFYSVNYRFLTNFGQIFYRILTVFFLPMAEGHLLEIYDLVCVFKFSVDDSSTWVSLLMT